MSALKKGAAAPAIPTIYVLKGEAIHLRAASKADGKTMGHRASLKQVAHKYGYRTWEALEAAARVSEANQGHHAYTQIQSDKKPTVVLMIINNNDQVLVVNRKIVATRDFAKGGFTLAGIAEDLALALGTTLQRDEVTVLSEFKPTGENLKSFAAVMGRADYVHALSQDEATSFARSVDMGRILINTSSIADAPQTIDRSILEVPSPGQVSGGAKMPLSKSFDEVVTIAQNFEEYEISHGQHIDFEILLETEDHPEHGEIDYMVSVTLLVESGKPIRSWYCAYVHTLNAGRIDALPPSDYLSRAQVEVTNLLNDLIEAGIDIDLKLLVDESKGKTFNP